MSDEKKALHIDYYVSTGVNLEELIHNVEDRIGYGYEPIGGVSKVEHGLYIQAMIRKRYESERS